MIDGNANKKVEYNYDSLGRLESKNINLATNDYLTTYTFKDGQGGTTTTQLEEIDNDGSSINYQYDTNGNITSITEDNQNISYQYDELNQLVRENNQVLNKTITYTYDTGGNITAKTEYPYTTGTPGTPTETINYSYGDSNWDDKLTSYDGKAIKYDQIGNPLAYDGYTYTWEEGRRLKSIAKTGLDMTFKYNADGIRTEKTVNGTTTSYHLLGDKVTFETNGTDEIYYTYDSNGNLISMNLNGTEYYYIRNGQGDIIGLHDGTGAEVVSYTYDTWGKIISIDGTLASTVGEKNPYRYRGYRYDSETGLYYLQSRYYNAEWGRFINADALGGKMGILLSHNVFTYCMNNPVNMCDAKGNFPIAIGTGLCFNPVGLIIGLTALAIVGTAYVVGKVIDYVIEEKNSKKKTKTGGIPANKDGFLNGEPGEIKNKTTPTGKEESHIGKDGRADKVRHHKDHSNPKYHTNPHDHIIEWINGKLKFSDPINNVDPNIFPMIFPLWDNDWKEDTSNDVTDYIKLFGR